jgi:hypothetical protein
MKPFLRSCLLRWGTTLIVGGASVVFAVGQAVLQNGAPQSWTATTQATAPNTNPTRTKESHTKSGQRTFDTKTVEVLNADGVYEPYYDVETETVQENATTTRSIARTYNPGVNGTKQLSQVTEEEAQNSANGDANRVRTTSNPDSNGNLQVVRREVTDTTKKDSESLDTQTTVYLIDISGTLAPSMQIQEQQKRGVNGELELVKTTSLRDANGGWQVYEVSERTIMEDGQNRSTDERISRRDFEGNISPVSKVVSHDAQVNGQATTTADTYSIDVPGSARDGKLHLVERATTVQKNDPGRTTTEQQIEQPDPGDPQAGLVVSTKTTNVIVSGVQGTEETDTSSTRNPDDPNFSVVSVQTKKTDQIPATQVRIAPSDKPK